MSYFVMNAKNAEAKVISFITYMEETQYPWNNEEYIKHRMKEGISTGWFFNKKVTEMTREQSISWLKNNSHYFAEDFSNEYYNYKYRNTRDIINQAKVFLGFIEAAINNNIETVNVSKDEAWFVK